MSCLDSLSNNPLFISSLTAQLIWLTFHVSVLACILRQRAKGVSAFRSGFFLIYIIQSFGDVTSFTLDFVFVRLAAVGCVSPHAFDIPYGNAVWFLMAYAANVQFAAHAAIALNRFFVLSDALSNRKGRYTIITILLISLPTATIRVFARSRLVETTTPGVYGFVRDVPWASVAWSTSLFVHLVVTTLVSIVFELRSLACYKRLAASVKERYRNDFLLLIYALLQFCVQLSVSICYGLFAVGVLIGNAQMLSVGAYVMHPSSIALCLSSSICLLSTSKLLRKAYY